MPKNIVFEKGWTKHSKFDKHSKIGSRHNLRGYVRPFIEHENPHFDNE